jgi:hypothetical protein
MVFVGNAPGHNAPRIGAGKTEIEKDRHFVTLLLLLSAIISVADNHVRLTKPDRAKRRLPTPTAVLQYDFTSCTAKPATALDKTAIKGHNKYISVTNCKFVDPAKTLSTNTGTSKDNVAAVAPIPTHKGVI